MGSNDYSEWNGMIDAPKMRSSRYVVGRRITPNPVFEPIPIATVRNRQLRVGTSISGRNIVLWKNHASTQISTPALVPTRTHVGACDLARLCARSTRQRRDLIYAMGCPYFCITRTLPRNLKCPRYW